MKRAVAMVLICSALAQGQDVVREGVVSTSRATLLLPDAGILEVEGGIWITDARAIELAQERVTYRAENHALKQGPTPVEIGAAFGGGVALGALGLLVYMLAAGRLK
jgi:hypothetical protein